MCLHYNMVKMTKKTDLCSSQKCMVTQYFVAKKQMWKNEKKSNKIVDI